MHTQVLDGLAGGTPIDSDWEVFCYRVEVHLSTVLILGFRVLPTAMINLFMDSSLASPGPVASIGTYRFQSDHKLRVNARNLQRLTDCWHLCLHCTLIYTEQP